MDEIELTKTQSETMLAEQGKKLMKRKFSSQTPKVKKKCIDMFQEREHMGSTKKVPRYKIEAFDQEDHRAVKKIQMLFKQLYMWKFADEIPPEVNKLFKNNHKMMLNKAGKSPTGFLI